MSEVVHYQWRIQDLQTRDKDEPPHAPRSSALGARIETPTGWAWRGVSPWDWEGSGMPARKKSISDIKMAILGAFWKKMFCSSAFCLNEKAVLLGLEN